MKPKLLTNNLSSIHFPRTRIKIISPKRRRMISEKLRQHISEEIFSEAMKIK